MECTWANNSPNKTLQSRCSRTYAISKSIRQGTLCLFACTTLLLGACQTLYEKPQTVGEEPTRQEAAGPSPKELIEERQNSVMPDFFERSHVAQFVDWATAAPVSRREEIRAQMHKAQDSDAIAKGLIEAFQKAEREDHTRALVILALLGELRNPTGTEFLIEYVWRELPTGGPVMVETGVSLERQNMVRLQVKAVNGLAYTRDPKVLREVLEIVAKHPSKAVRTEAASSYLWNQGNSESARKTLSQYVREGESALIDRPVRGVDMSGEQFNRQLELFLKRHPELQPPAPTQREPVEEKPTEADQPPRF